MTEELARIAARLRGAASQPSSIAATDAVVAALATTVVDPVVLTSDPKDLQALLANDDVPVVRG